MTQTIARMYATKKAATQAATALKEFGLEDVHLVTAPAKAAAAASAPAEGEAAPPPAKETPEAREAILAALRKAGIEKDHAAIYAERIAGGAAMTIVHAPFGFASRAQKILHRSEPIDSGVAEPEYPMELYDEAAPLSWVLGMPVLSSDPMPASRVMGLSALSPTAAPLSDMFGMPTLSSNPAPLSSLFGMKLLSDKAAPLSDAIGMKTLSDNPAPLSKAIGMPTLSDKAAPLSDAIGMSTVMKGK
jgi:hypothetical protein